MNTFLETVAANAFFATILALLAGTCAAWTRRPQIAYWLWLLVLVKLVTPPVMKIPLPVDAPRTVAAIEVAAPRDAAVPAIAGTPTAASADPATALPPDSPRLANGWNYPPDPEEMVFFETSPRPERDTGAGLLFAAMGRSWRGILFTCWAAGALGWLTLAGMRLIRFHRLLGSAQPAPPSMQAKAGELAERLALKRCPEVRTIRGRIPPLLWWAGRKPLIVLPADLLKSLDDSAQETLLAHELAHYRRRDHWVRVFEMVIRTLYWWNPVAWWALRELHKAEEQCCDAWVLWAFPEGSKKYAKALLDTIEFLSPLHPRTPCLATGFATFRLPFQHLKRRFQMILNNREKRNLTWRGSLAMTLLALAVLPFSADTIDAKKTVEKEAAEVESDATSPSTALRGGGAAPRPAAEVESDAASPSTSALITKTIRLKFARAKEVAEAVEKLFSDQKLTLIADERMNSILLRGSQGELGEIELVVEELDRDGPPGDTLPGPEPRISAFSPMMGSQPQGSFDVSAMTSPTKGNRPSRSPEMEALLHAEAEGRTCEGTLRTRHRA